MDKKIASVIFASVCIMLLATLAVTVNLSVPSVYAANGTTVYTDPALVNYTAPPTTTGTLFNVSVWVDNVTLLCAYQVQVIYNATILDCIDAIEPESDPNYILYNLTRTMVTENVQIGKYTIGGSEFPGDPPAKFNGTGLITIFRFNITAVPGVGETLASLLNITNTQTFLLDNVGATIPIVKQDGNYELWYVPDTTPPEIEILSPEQSGVYGTSTVPLEFTVDEPVSWMGYSLDDGANVTITGNTTLTSLSEGDHTIVVYANDTSNNMGASNIVSFTVDLTPPIIQDPTQEPPSTNVQPNQQVKVSVNVTDAISDIDTVILSYKNDTTWYNVTMTYNATAGLYTGMIPGFAAGTHVSYQIIAYDLAGNMAVNDNEGTYYPYTVVPEFISSLMMILVLVAITTFVIALRKRTTDKTLKPP